MRLTINAVVGRGLAPAVKAFLNQRLAAGASPRPTIKGVVHPTDKSKFETIPHCVRYAHGGEIFSFLNIKFFKFLFQQLEEKSTHHASVAAAHGERGDCVVKVVHRHTGGGKVVAKPHGSDHFLKVLAAP